MLTAVEFNQLFQVLKNRLSDGDDVPCFFRELISMITTVSEAEWGTVKDPATKLTNDETIRSYAKRKLTKKFARSIVYRLTPEILIKRINKRPETVRRLLADDFHGYDPLITAENVGETVAKWMVDIIRTSAGLVQQEKLVEQKQQSLAANLKAKYGIYLLNEAGEHCPFPGCDKMLTITHEGKVVHSYEVSVIDKSKPAKEENLLALCPRCYAMYQLDGDKKRCKELKSIKTLLSAHKQSVRILDDLPLEQGIIGVMKRVAGLKEKDLTDAELNPKDLTEKICPSDNMALYLTVKNFVTTYYVRMKEIMMSLDKRGDIDYDEIQHQMGAIYRRLKKSKRTKDEIFNEISSKVHRVSLQDDVYCQIVVSYFIQSCEVYDAIS